MVWVDVGYWNGRSRIKVDPNPGLQIEVWSGQNIQQLRNQHPNLDIQASFTKTRPCHAWSSTTKEAVDKTAGLDKGPGSLKLPLFSAVRTRYGAPPSLSRVECRVNQGCIQMNPRRIPPSKKRLDGCATRKQIGGTGGQVMQRGPRSNELGSSPRVPCLPGTTTAPTQPVIRARQDEPEGGHYANRPVTSRSSGA